MLNGTVAHQDSQHPERDIFGAYIPKKIRRKMYIIRNKLVGINSRHTMLFVCANKEQVACLGVKPAIGKYIIAFTRADITEFQLCVVMHSERVGLALLFAVKTGKKQAVRCLGIKIAFRNPHSSIK